MGDLYVDRDRSNNVVSVFRNEQTPGQEKLDEAHADVVAYKNSKINTGAISDKEEELRANDIDLFRMILVMYQVGVNKGLWVKADFDAEDPTIVAKGVAWKQLLNELEAM